MLTVRNLRFVTPTTSQAPFHESLSSIYALSLGAIALLCIAMLELSMAAGSDGGFDLDVLAGGLI